MKGPHLVVLVLWALLNLLPPPVHPDRFNELQYNAEHFREGVDLAKFNLIDSVAFGRTRTIFHFTHHHNGTTPDQIERPVVESSTGDDDEVAFLTSNSAISTHVSVSISANGKECVDDDKKIETTLSAAFSRQREQVNNENMYMLSSFTLMKVYRLKLNHSMIELTAEFKQALEEERSSNGTYYEVVQTFGTHYLTDGVFGGRKSIYALGSGSMYRMVVGSDASLKAKLEDEVKTSFGTEIEINSNVEKSEEVFKASRKCMVIGGKSSANPCYSEDEHATWRGSVDEQPSLIQVQLSPIYKLAPLKEHREALELATARYLLYAELNYLKKQLEGNLLLIKRVSEVIQNQNQNEYTFYSAANSILAQMDLCLSTKQVMEVTMCTQVYKQSKALYYLLSLIPAYKDIINLQEKYNYIAKRFECQDNMPCAMAELKEPIKAIRSSWLGTYYRLEQFLEYFNDYASNIETQYKSPFSYNEKYIFEVISEWQRVLKVAEVDTFNELYECGFWCIYTCTWQSYFTVGTNWIPCNPING